MPRGLEPWNDPRETPTIRLRAELKGAAGETRSALGWAREAVERRNNLIRAAHRQDLAVSAIGVITELTEDAVREILLEEGS